MVQNEKKKPGRPRAYDPEAALDAALDVFWRSGFASTSMDDVTAATGMNRPSLYAAFGDKRCLYLKAIKHYRVKMRDQVSTAFTEDRPVREAMNDIYDHALDLYFGNIKTPLGCFLICAVAPDIPDDPEVRAIMSEGLNLLDDAWRRRIKKAQDEGEIGKSIDAATLAKVASGTLYYLSIRARTGEPRETLEGVARATVDLICNA